MAEAEAGSKAAGGALSFLKNKAGPFPLGVWLAGGLGIWYYLKRQQAASTSTSAAGASAAPAAGTSQTGFGTDPAGNTGYIDPQTGYVYGSAEDVAALQTESGTLTGAGSSDTSGGTSVTQGTSTVTAPTGGTTSTTTGAGTGAGTGWAYPAPTGLAANSVSDSGFRLSWNPVTGPGGQKPASYAVGVWQENGVKVSQHDVTTTSSIEYGPGGSGLKPGTPYKVLVWANGGPVAPPGASAVVTTKPKGQG
jgi:Fibronectin type III domain